LLVKALLLTAKITFENVEMLENLCFVGGIPVVSEFALKQWPTEIRHEAAAFVRQVCQTSTLALQMFVSCGGLNVLVGFLEEDMESERDLVLIGVNGVCCVFELQVWASVTKNHLTREGTDAEERLLSHPLPQFNTIPPFSRP
jgi:hypothetical protein